MWIARLSWSAWLYLWIMSMVFICILDSASLGLYPIVLFMHIMDIEWLIYSICIRTYLSKCMAMNCSVEWGASIFSSLWIKPCHLQICYSQQFKGCQHLNSGLCRNHLLSPVNTHTHTQFQSINSNRKGFISKVGGCPDRKKESNFPSHHSNCMQPNHCVQVTAV